MDEIEAMAEDRRNKQVKRTENFSKESGDLN